LRPQRRAGVRATAAAHRSGGRGPAARRAARPSRGRGARLDEVGVM
nr:hypothetical protein [Tanacetum cinerariifolium]